MNLLLVDKSLNSLQTFLNGCNSNTKCVLYEPSDSFDDIKNSINNLGEVSFSHLGFVFENSGIVKLFVSNNSFVSFDESGVIPNNVTEFIKLLVNTYNINKVDFLACDLLLDNRWRSYFELLQNQSSDKNLIVRASNNKSGNLQYGGDWVLETTNEDVTSLYFNELIGEWSYLLDYSVSYSAILTNDQLDNLYTAGSPAKTALGQDHLLLMRNATYQLTTTTLLKNIVSIYCKNNAIAVITDETTNNLYVYGNNVGGELGLGNTSPVTTFTQVGGNILDKKVIQVVFSKTNNVMYVLTDESTNNLYSAGNNASLLGLGGTTSNLLQRNTSLNKKILMISSGSQHFGVITDDLSNNVYLSGTNSSGSFGDTTYTSSTYNTLVRINTASILSKRIVSISCGFNNTLLISDEATNNLYGSGANTLGSLGNSTTTNVAEFINIKPNSILNKTVEYVTSSPYNTTQGTAILTTESSNNLYVTGYNVAGGLGAGSTVSINIFTKITQNILNKKVTQIDLNVRTATLLTSELSNNIYAAGDDRSLITAGIDGSSTGLDNRGNVSLNFQNVSNISTNLLDKKVKLVNSNTTTSVIIVDGISTNNNIYTCGPNSSPIILNTDNLLFKKIDSQINKKIINIVTVADYILAITNESTNNLYACGVNTPFLNTALSSNSSNHFPKLTNVSLQQVNLLNKKITNISSNGVISYVITDETSNNLYGSNSGGYIGDGFSVSRPTFVKINQGVLSNKKIIKISAAGQYNGLLTSELTNNFYMCGNYGSGVFGNGLTSGFTNSFINITHSNILNKTFVDIECSGSGDNKTFLLSNETTNNLYACGNGLLGTGSSSSSQSTFLNITNNILGKRVGKVISSPNNYNMILLDEDISTLGNTNLYVCGGSTGSGLTSISNSFTPVTTLAGKKVLDVRCSNQITMAITDEATNNIYMTGNNIYGVLGSGNKTNITTFTKPVGLTNIKGITYIPPVNTAPFLLNTSIAGNNTQIKYSPKAFNIGNNNVINFPSPANRTISVSPVATNTASQNYSSVLGVTAKNVVSGYIKLEPAGTTFQNHISLDFDVEAGLDPVVFFKSSNDIQPVLVPSTNTSANDVYYTFVKSTGTVTLYTKHFSEAIVTQDTGLSSPKVDFSLTSLNTSITMSVSGDILKLDIPSLEVDAIAEYYIKADDMRKVFIFQTDSDDVDTITNGTDIKYFVRKNQWPSGLVLNPCHAWVQSSLQVATTDKLGVIADNRELVKHDFVRHIAKSLFNTHLAVDLFTNEDDLKYDLAYKGHNTAWGNIWNSLVTVSDASLNTTTYANLYGQDASYGYYLTGDASANTNICRQLLSQLIKTAPTRLQNLNTYVVDASKGYYSVPLLDGDSISFKLTLNTAPNQHLLVNRPTPVPSRSYQIRINLRDSVSKGSSHADAVNVIVNDTAPLSYGGVAVTNNLNSSYPANY
jgi:hypothetical protein